MTNDDAIQQLFGPGATLTALLEQRRGIAAEAVTTMQDLRRRLSEHFPIVDSFGSAVDHTLKMDAWTMKFHLEKLDEAIAMHNAAVVADSATSREP